MQFFQFKEETLSRQAQILCREGVYLSERTAGDFFIALYALSGYYAEVYYRQQCNELLMITSFEDTALLEPYLTKINLQPVLLPALYQ